MKEKKKSETIEWLKAIVLAVLLAAGIRAFIFSPIIVDGQSMMPTLESEDRMIVNKLNYKISEPKRFDIIVFHADEEHDYIKRIIGLPGDHIEYKDDTLYVNGKAYNEPYLDEYKNELPEGSLTPDFTLEETAVGKKTVPEGHLFVMGDNRRYSKDSRHIGAVPIKEVLGDTNLVYWPLEEAGTVQ